MEDRQPARPGICIHAPWRARNAPAAGQPGHRVAELVIGPLLQLLPTMLHREALVAFPVEPQHAQDLLGRRTSARRLADPPITQALRPLTAQSIAPPPKRPLLEPLHLRRFLLRQLAPLMPLPQSLKTHLSCPLQHSCRTHPPLPLRAVLKPDR